MWDANNLGQLVHTVKDQQQPVPQVASMNHIML
jgi:hypothetical protein